MSRRGTMHLAIVLRLCFVPCTLKMPNAPQLPEEQVRYLVEKLYNGFFALRPGLTETGIWAFVEYAVSARCLKVEMKTVKTVPH